MSLDRVLEPELMDTPEDATEYDSMDHSAVNRAFVDDLLAAIDQFLVQRSKFHVEDRDERTLNQEPGTLSLDILDLGTGTALIPVELCGRYRHCRVMAGDAAASMLDLAHYNVQATRLADRIQLVQFDAKRLGFEDAMFDVVMSNSIVHHIPDPASVLREAVRVTRPGGLLFVRDLLRPESAEQLEGLVGTYAGEANEYQQRLFRESLHAALSLDEIRALVESLGFSPDTATQTSDRHWTWTARPSECGRSDGERGRSDGERGRSDGERGASAP